MERRHERASAWHARVSGMTSASSYVDWVSGAALLVRRDLTPRRGLLDERYFLYTEDVDFCAAIRARGRRILFTPGDDHAPARPVAPTAPVARERRLPAKPPGVLREASSALGVLCCHA